MNDLIKVTQNETHSVSAKELYTFLEIKTDFSEWCKRMFSYGFVEQIDFTPFLGKTSNTAQSNGFSQICEKPAQSTQNKGGRPSVDYMLTIDCAKEIAMIQRTERGKQARQYFIEVEKRYKEVQRPMSPAEQLLASAQLLVEHERRIQLVENETATLAASVANIEAKQTTINDEYFALAGYYRFKKIRFNLTNVQAQQTGRTLARMSENLGYSVLKAHDSRYGAVNTYHKNVLQAVCGF